MDTENEGAHLPRRLSSKTAALDLPEALREAVIELPLQDRVLIALRYGADLGDEQIASDTGWTPASIARRSRIVANGLCRRLGRVGAAPARRTLNAGLLRDAICGGISTPPGLHERVLARIQRQGQCEKPRTRTNRKAPGRCAENAKGLLPALFATTTAILGALSRWVACMGAWLRGSGRKAAPRNSHRP
jgi:hypothetical protein